jgi:seryl-tRNA synthetase
MNDIRDIRRDPERFRESQRRRGQDPSLIDDLLLADAELRALRAVEQELRSALNRLTDRFGRAKREGASETELWGVQLEMSMAELDAAIRSSDIRVEFMDRRQRKFAADFCAAAGVEYGEEDYEAFRAAALERTNGDNQG